MAEFRGALFENTAEFGEATFGGWAGFQGAAFRTMARFGRAIFQGGAGFEGATFGDAAGFERARFEAATVFDGAQFAEAPDFRDATLPFSTTWRRVNWSVPRQCTADQDVEHYAALRHAMDTAKRHDAELDFFVRELQAKRHTDIPHLQRFAIGAYLAIADGGRSFGRPAMAWLSGFATSIVLHAPIDRGYIALERAVALETLAAVVGNALVFASPVLDRRKLHFLETEIGLHFPAWLQAFDVMHAGFSALCLFLMALAVRNWLRLR
jgi:hypothetical protein